MRNFHLKILILFLIVTGFYSATNAQTPRFVKYPVMESGTLIYMPSEPTFDKSYSEDSSEVYTCQVDFGNAQYGAIIVKIKEALGSDTIAWEELLLSYMEFLSSSAFMLTNVMEPGYGHTLESHPAARGILMYGEDADKKQYAIKGWVDENFIAVLYVSSMEEMNYNFQNLYLNGFRFPEK